MGKGLTVSEVKKAVWGLRGNSVTPNVVKTQEEAESINRAERLLGLGGQWKKGDEYFIVMNGTVGRA